ncbi:MAG: Holliday junction branch migration protein RuvA [Thermoanaerobaculia bacterium]
MIAYLEGPIRTLDTNRVVLMAGGVGYLVHIPLSTYYKLEGKSTAALEIHTHVREDALSLFGFATTEERETFEKLISISGIGPRLAQVILSGIEVGDLTDAVMRSDSRRLASIPGVGKKTSERICLELRDKLVAGEKKGAALPSPRGGVATDVVSALVNLGYKENVAENAVRTSHEETAEEPEFSTLLKSALKKLTR